MLESLMGNPTAWGILSLIAVFSALFAIYTWIAGKKKKQFSLVCKTNEVIASGKSKIEKLFIQYNGEEIENLSISKFFIWNSGNEVINKSDIVSSRPLSIICSEPASILDAQIIKTNENTNAFSIAGIRKQRVDFDFDYVDQGDGFVVQILHTGQAVDLDLDCKIKGGKEIRDISSIKRKKTEPKNERAASFFIGIQPSIWGLIFLGASILLTICISHNEDISKTLRNILVLLLILGGAVPGFLIGKLIQKTINSKFHRTVPHSLEE